MNKKQLIVAWVMGITISVASLSLIYETKKEPVYRKLSQEEIAAKRKSNEAYNLAWEKVEMRRRDNPDDFNRTFSDFDEFLLTGESLKDKLVLKERQYKGILSHLMLKLIPLFVIGGLLIYTLKDKRR